MNLSKNGTHEFTGKEVSGGILSDFQIHSFRLDVNLSSSVRTPVVRVIPLNDSEESRKLVRESEVSQYGNRLTVRLPKPKGMAIGGGGMAVVTGGSVSVNGITYQGPVSIIDGVVRTGSNAVRAMNAGVRVEAVLPSLSSLDISSLSGDAEIDGQAESINFRSVSGDLEIDVARTLIVNTTSGNVEADKVFGDGSITTISGDVVIERYEGHHLTLNTVSGDVKMTAGGDAQGTISANTVSGDLRMGNVKNRPNLTYRRNTISGRIRES